MQTLTPESLKTAAEIAKTAPNIFLLGVAGVSLVIGLIILAKVNRKGFENPLSWSLVCWIFIALFPVFMIFSFFPSDARGEIFGFTLTGAFAGYIFIWWFGSKKYIDAVTKDELNRKIQYLEDQLENAKILGKPQSEKLTDGTIHTYKLAADENKKIMLITGNLTAIKKKIDVWVNSENTNMQMASYFDRSISGAIRYCGAKKDEAGNVTDDIISKELKTKMGKNLSVSPATVFVTGSGELQKSNKVKNIFHVASVQGTAGHGYRPVLNIADCVRNVLDKSRELPDPKPQSILFPLLGTGQGGGGLKPTVKLLIDTTLAYYLDEPEGNTVNSVYFLTYSDDQLAACKEVLDAHKLRGLLTVDER